MTLKDVIRRPAIRVLSDTPIWRVAETMGEFKVGFLPVLEHNKVVGVLTAKDIAMRVTAQGHLIDNLHHLPASAVMTCPAKCLPAEVDVEEAVLLMRMADIHRVIVLDAEFRLAGVVSLADLAGVAPDASIVKNLQRHAELSLPTPSEFIFPVPGMYVG